MANENENLNSSNETDGQESETDIEESSLEETDDVVALKEQIKDLSDKNKKLFGRAKKSEGEVKVLKEQVKPPKENLESQSNEPDYAKIAYLNSVGVFHPDDQKLAQDEALRLKLPLTDVLQMEHIKSKLQTSKDQREAQAGLPKGKPGATGKAQQDVDYWIDQRNPDGSYKTPEDLELATKVIEARIKKETTGNKFSDELYTG